MISTLTAQTNSQSGESIHDPVTRALAVLGTLSGGTWRGRTLQPRVIRQRRYRGRPAAAPCSSSDSAPAANLLLRRDGSAGRASFTISASNYGTDRPAGCWPASLEPSPGRPRRGPAQRCSVWSCLAGVRPRPVMNEWRGRSGRHGAPECAAGSLRRTTTSSIVSVAISVTASVAISVAVSGASGGLVADLSDAVMCTLDARDTGGVCIRPTRSVICPAS